MIDGPTPKTPENLDTLTLVLFSLTFVMIGGVVVVMFFMIATAKPLRDYIFEEIFIEIGANRNAVEAYHSRTAFFGTNKVDLITHLLYLNTLGFLCYDLTVNSDVKMLTYWIVLGCFTLIALLNNFHGYRIMQTTASSFNTKFYFFTRSFLQLLYIYLSVTLIARRTLWWDEFSVEHED